MVRLVKEIDKAVNDLTPEELSELDWSSVLDTEIKTIREELYLHCTDPDRIFSNIPCTDMSNSTALQLIKNAMNARKVPSAYYRDLVLRELIDEWCTAEFIRHNMGFFQRIRNKELLQHSEVALAQKGIVNINSINVSYDIIDWYILNDVRISTDERFQYLKNTNHLASNIRDIPCYTPICLNSKQLEELKLPAPFECYVSRSDYEPDAPDYKMTDDIPKLPNKIYWDEALDMYLKGMICYETVSTIWCDIYDQHPHLHQDAGLFSTTFMRPGMDMKTTRGFV